MLEDWYFFHEGKLYWEWRHAYRKLLSYILDIRYNWKRVHSTSDLQFVKILKRNLHSCQLWLEEMRHPKEAVFPYLPQLQLEIDF
jgi:hypothetical protein